MKLTEQEREQFKQAVTEAVEELGIDVIKSEEFFGMNQPVPDNADYLPWGIE